MPVSTIRAYANYRILRNARDRGWPMGSLSPEVSFRITLRLARGTVAQKFEAQGSLIVITLPTWGKLTNCTAPFQRA